MQVLSLGRGQCELLCKAEGFGFFDMLADQVIDGTPCTEDKNMLCIQGKCMVSLIGFLEVIYLNFFK